MTVTSGAFGQSTGSRQKVTAPKLTDEERAMVADSRRAIVATGVSEAYFDAHYALVKVVNQPGDRRIVWKFHVNRYETTVNDVLGFYTKDGKRVDTHSVASTLRRTTEIEKTISRAAANRIMRQCIGKFVHPAIELIASRDEARLVITAEAVPKTIRGNKKEEREREERERTSEQKNKRGGSDVIENEGDNGPPIIIASVDLQSGKCTKGRLVSTP